MALDTKRITLCWPNYIDNAHVSGGAWVNSLPLQHIKDRRFSVVAKTASLDPADTQFTLTLDRRRPMSVLAIPAHNMSTGATIRVRIYRDAERTDLVYDSGMREVWPVIYALEDVVWGNDNFWNRRLSEEDRQTYTPLLTLFFNERLIAMSAHVELFDPGNPEGGIMLGRVMLADVWQPRYNVSYGIQDGHDTGTEITTAGDPARTEYARRFTPKRTVKFQLSHLNEEEAFLRLHRLQRVQDIVGEILYVYSTAPSPINFTRTMIARQTDLDPITNPYHANFENTIELLEIL